MIPFLLINVLIALSKCDDSNLPDSYKLPSSLRPIRYKLKLEPDLTLKSELNNTRFVGRVIIEIECLEATNNITLHALGLIVNEVQVRHSDQTVLNITSTEYDKTRQLFVIYLRDVLKEQETYYMIIENYTGYLSVQNTGFYIGEYEYEGTKR
jgi:aminopeptidase N